MSDPRDFDAFVGGVRTGSYVHLIVGFEPNEKAISVCLQLAQVAKKAGLPYYMQYARLTAAIFTQLTRVWRWRFKNNLKSWSAGSRGLRSAIRIPPLAAVWCLRGGETGTQYDRFYVEGDDSADDDSGCDLQVGFDDQHNLISNRIWERSTSVGTSWPEGIMPALGRGSVCEELCELTGVDPPKDTQPENLIQWTVQVVSVLHTKAGILAISE